MARAAAATAVDDRSMHKRLEGSRTHSINEMNEFFLFLFIETILLGPFCALYCIIDGAEWHYW